MASKRTRYAPTKPLKVREPSARYVARITVQPATGGGIGRTGARSTRAEPAFAQQAFAKQAYAHGLEVAARRDEAEGDVADGVFR